MPVRNERPAGRLRELTVLAGAVAALAIGLSILSLAGAAAVAQAAPKRAAEPCQSAFPDARQKTIGKTTWYNRQESVRMILCYRFGLDPSADFRISASMVCGALAQVIGKGAPRLGLFADGACSGADLASQPKEPAKYIGAACGWVSDLLGVLVKPAGVLGSMGCTIAPSVGHALGGMFESDHEFDVAVDVIRHGKCIKYSPTHFGSPWLAEDCADGDKGFATLPVYKPSPPATPSPGASGSSGGGSGSGSSPVVNPPGSGGSNRLHVTTPGGIFTQVTSGWDFSCGLRVGGAVECWGWKAVNETGPPGGSFRTVGAGETFTCGVRTDKTLACWGFEPPSPPAGSFTQVSSDENHACALTTSGSAKCWGDPSGGQTDPPAGAYKQLAVGDDYSCGLRTSGAVVCWGDPIFGLPVDEESGPFTQISSGAEHLCALDSSGTIFCWGYDGQGQTNVPGGIFAEVSAAGWHTCALRTGGAVVCWGEEGNGENLVPPGSYIEIDAGRFHACARRSDGTVICWGGGGVEF